MKDQRTEAMIRDQNLAVATNVVEMVTQAVLEVAGNDVANTINGELVGQAFLKEAVTAKIQSTLAPIVGEG